MASPTRDQADSGTAARPQHRSGGLRPLADEMDDALIWSVVDAAPDGIVMVDESGQIVLVNRQTETLFGTDRGELLGRSIEDLLPERFRSVHRAHRTRYRADPQPRSMGAGQQLFGRRVDGTEFPVEISLSPVTSAEGLRIIAAVRDITERVDAESRSREIHEILDATRDAVSILDAETLRFTYVNQGFIDQVGYQHDELLTMGMLHVAPEFDEATLRALLAPFEQREITVRTFRTVHRRRDGSDVPVEIMMQAIAHDGHAPHAYVKIARDITERLEMEDRRRRTEQELRLAEDRERLARDLHDVVIQRLFASGMAAQSLQARIPDERLAARAGEIVDQLDATIREIRTAIFGLTAVERDSAGLRHQVLRVVEDERGTLGVAPQLTFEGVIDDTDPEVAGHLLAVLREALSNIARHANATTVSVAVESTAGEIALRVCDDGVGVGGDAGAGGNGLRNLTERARALAGSFAITPAPGGGTLLEFRVPRRATT